jgi:hypothetical protein
MNTHATLLETIEAANNRIQIAAAFAQKYGPLMPDNFGMLVIDHLFFCISINEYKDRAQTIKQLGDIFGPALWTESGNNWEKTVDGVRVIVTGLPSKPQAPRNVSLSELLAVA